MALCRRYACCWCARKLNQRAAASSIVYIAPRQYSGATTKFFHLRLGEALPDLPSKTGYTTMPLFQVELSIPRRSRLRLGLHLLSQQLALGTVAGKTFRAEACVPVFVACTGTSFWRYNVILGSARARDIRYMSISCSVRHKPINHRAVPVAPVQPRHSGRTSARW
eukprot:COSAG03_NODE_13087_length_517_cov_0.978469_1_plen_165_part_10